MDKEEVKIKLKNILKFTLEDIEKLNIFHDELLKFNKKYNLISNLLKTMFGTGIF